MHIVVGGGPVGLFLACLLCLDGEKVVVFEKRESYTRDHPVQFWPEFWLKMWIYPVFYTSIGSKFYQTLRSLPKNNTVHIQHLEQVLSSWLRTQFSSHCYIYRSEVKSMDDLVRELNKRDMEHLFESVETIFACDGAHSKWRTRYFFTDSRRLQRVIDVKHSPMSEDQKNTLPSSFHILSSTRTHIPLDDTESIPIVEADLRHLAALKGFPQQVIQNARRLDYNSYWSQRACYKPHRLFLCGDSLCGVPYTRALRNGFLCALNAAFWVKDPQRYEKYEDYYTRLRIQENVVTNTISLYLNPEQFLRRATARMWSSLAAA